MYQASETKAEGRVIPLLNHVRRIKHTCWASLKTVKKMLCRKEGISLWLLYYTIFCMWMFFLLKVNLLDNIEEEGCFTWEGQYYCLGDCIVQDLSEPAEYCPAEGEEPSLVYNYTVNTEAKCKDGSTPVFHYRRASPGGENKWTFRFEGGDMYNSVKSWEYRSEECFQQLFISSKDTPAIVYQDGLKGVVRWVGILRKILITGTGRPFNLIIALPILIWVMQIRAIMIWVGMLKVMKVSWEFFKMSPLRTRALKMQKLLFCRDFRLALKEC